MSRLLSFLRSPRFPLFMIVFVDTLGVGITMPVLPLFAKNELGAAAWQVTALTSVYFLAQFLAGPWLGRLSDRVGRRPVLIASQAGTLGALLLTGAAPSLLFIYLARIVDGLTGGNVSVAQAYMSDISDEHNRAQGLGTVNAGFGLGFIFGPAFGGLVASFLGPRWPFFIAAGVSLVTVLLSTFLLPESLPRERRQRETAAGAVRPTGSLDLLRQAPILILLLVAFMGQVAFFSFQTIHVLWAEQVVLAGLSAELVQRTVGGVLTLVGVCQLFVQFGLIGPLVRRLGEARLVVIGRVAGAAAFGLMALLPRPLVWVLAVPFVAFGNGVAQPTLIALLTYAAPPGRRGQLIGLQQSFAAAGSVFGPLLTGWIFENIQPNASMAAASILMALTVLLALNVFRYPHQRPAAVDAVRR